MTKKEYDKQYHLNKPEYAKQWLLTNKESKKQYDKQRYLNNKELYQKQNEKRYSRIVLSYHIVYLLPDHNYVGVTNQPKFRMYEHKSTANRNTDNWIELARYTDRKEALAHEARLHSEGYEGGKVCYNITQEA